ncbi:MAG: hypothetical protein LLG40_04165 [Deltaproteobacteria bacterium]|nr:hypothetical protein [Deltaproteobacteria bacterium]
MQPDLFGNLKDWGPVLEKICELAENGKLSEYQPGLTRILSYRDNWRLCEETLKRIVDIQNPSDALIRQVLRIIADGNLYYEVRIIACESMAALLMKSGQHFEKATKTTIPQTVRSLRSIPQPPIFEKALKNLYSVAD